MREILFRGKRIDNGEWAYGLYCYNNVNHLIFMPDEDDFTFITPETVGQFTGLTDKNGVKIFEKDILYVPNYEHTEHKVRCLVEWDELNLSFTTFSPRSSFFVLGNKFDNPEILNE